jgi:hypothetical protein
MLVMLSNKTKTYYGTKDGSEFIFKILGKNTLY